VILSPFSIPWLNRPCPERQCRVKKFYNIDARPNSFNREVLKAEDDDEEEDLLIGDIEDVEVGMEDKLVVEHLRKTIDETNQGEVVLFFCCSTALRRECTFE